LSKVGFENGAKGFFLVCMSKNKFSKPLEAVDDQQQQNG